MRMRAFCVAVAAACLASLATGRASADSIGPVNTVGSTISTGINGTDPFQPSEAAWIVGTISIPMQFGYSPSAGYWQKNLDTDGPVDPGDEVNLIEYVQNTGSVPWTTWTEKLLTSGWQFDNTPGDTDDTWYSVNGGLTQVQGTVSSDGSTITYSFSTPITTSEERRAPRRTDVGRSGHVQRHHPSDPGCRRPRALDLRPARRGRRRAPRLFLPVAGPNSTRTQLRTREALPALWQGFFIARTRHAYPRHEPSVLRHDAAYRGRWP